MIRRYLSKPLNAGFVMEHRNRGPEPLQVQFVVTAMKAFRIHVFRKLTTGAWFLQITGFVAITMLVKPYIVHGILALLGISLVSLLAAWYARRIDTAWQNLITLFESYKQTHSFAAAIVDVLETRCLTGMQVVELNLFLALLDRVTSKGEKNV